MRVDPFLHACAATVGIVFAFGCAARGVTALPGASNADAVRRSMHGAGGPAVASSNVSDATFVRAVPMVLEGARSAANGDSSVDLCIAPAKPACGIQGHSLALRLMLVDPPPGLRVSYAARTLPKGVSASFSPRTTSTPPYASTERLSFADDARVTNRDTEVIVPSCSARFLCNSETVDFEVMCSVVRNTCPRLQIEDANRRPTMVGGSPPRPTRTVVGAQAALSLNYAQRSGTTSAGYAGPTKIEWGIPGDPIASYERDGKAPIPLPASALSANEVRFCYYVPGIAMLTAHGELVRKDGEEIAVAAAQALYDVRRPRVHVSVQRTEVNLERVGRSERLTFSRGKNAGIAFAYRVDDEPGAGGEVAATQLIDWTSSTVLTQSGTVTTNHAPGGAWLDLAPDYPPGPVRTGVTWRSTDSPVSDLRDDWRGYSRSDRFTTYLMYKPDGRGVWVTLGTVDWGWSGFAGRDRMHDWCLGGYPGCSESRLSTATAEPPSQRAPFPAWVATRGPASEHALR